MKENKYLLGALVEPLCLWYEKNRRSMPWREDASPYHVWVSEIMLQQTRIEAAKAYYERFIERLPDIRALAEVPEEELLKLWEGLGYYNRVRNLQKAAKCVVEKYQGRLPASYEQLRKLPGIGPYTAGAIASIAFGIPAPAVDGNVMRVTMRFLNCEDDIMKQAVRRDMEEAIGEVIPREKPGEFNQALMELGEVVCIPNGTPLCGKCPLEGLCEGHRRGNESLLPRKPEKKQRRIEKRTILVLKYHGKVAIAKRPEKGLLAGLWEFPGVEGAKTLPQMKEWLREQGVCHTEVTRLKSGSHIFSHVEWQMRGYQIEVSEPTTKLRRELIWAALDELQTTYAIPAAFRSFLTQLNG